METDILIVGGGLAGLALADKLEAAGLNWQLIEACDQLGGRIASHQMNGQGFDLGPTWFWPGQHRMLGLTKRFNLDVFTQFSQGMTQFQDAAGKVHANRGYASMEGSLRIRGGIGRLIDALAQVIPNEKVHLSSPLKSLSEEGKYIIATTQTSHITAKHVVLAIPPRVAVETLDFTPKLSAHQRESLTAIPTWMAGQAKIVALFDRPYWREKGFSGDVISHHGPMTEIHDASPLEGGPYALFGFVGVPPDPRRHYRHEIIQLAKQQLVDVFGNALAEPVDIQMQDWAQEPTIATALDRSGLRSHPVYGYPRSLKGLWNGKLHLATTEMGDMFGGFLEGALEAGDVVYHTILHQD